MLKHEIIKSLPTSNFSVAITAGARRVSEWTEQNTTASVVSVSHSVMRLDDGRWQATFIVWYHEY